MVRKTSSEMAKKNIIDSWKWVTDLESTRSTKRFASLSNGEMDTILEKKKKKKRREETLGENKKNNKLVCDNISMEVKTMQYLK